MAKPRKKETKKKDPSSRRYNNYSEKNLQNALKAIKEGKISINKAAIKYKIAKGTLVNKVHGKHCKSIGAAPLFSLEEEKTLVNYVATIKKWGYPFAMNDLKLFAKLYLDIIRKEPPKFGAENMPGREWASRFMKSHRDALNVEHHQSVVLTRKEKAASLVAKFFDCLQESLRDKNSEVSPSRIFNFSLVNMSHYPFAKKTFYKQMKKYAPFTGCSGASVMFCGSATGMVMPPFVVYDAECMSKSWTKGGPSNTKYSISSGGCFDPGLFLEWFQTVFIPYVKNFRGRVVLLGDYASSLFSPMVLELAKENDIVFACVPDSVSRQCQPFEFSFYPKLEYQWQTLLEEWREANGPEPIERKLFPGLLNRLLTSACNVIDEGGLYSQDLVEGFRETGMQPFKYDNTSQKTMIMHLKSAEKCNETDSRLEEIYVFQGTDSSFKDSSETENSTTSVSLLQRKTSDCSDESIHVKKDVPQLSHEPIIVYLST